MTPRKTLTIALLIMALGIGYYSMNTASVLSDESHTYHGDTAWKTDVDEAMETAAAEDKPVLVYFWTTWCTYCEDYNKNAYVDPDVNDRLDDFVLLAVNLDDSSPEAKDLQQRYNANYPPQHVAITPDGELLVEINGYAETDSFIAYLDEAQSEWESR
ncbi:thioredoxin family protein [Natronorubrum aibiense]